jgi:Flp pilus assembly pilin Flp
MLTTLTVRLLATLTVLATAFADRFGVKKAQLRGTAPLAVRGVTMVEYALMAAIALIIAGLIQGSLTGAFTGILSRITKGFGG